MSIETTGRVVVGTDLSPRAAKAIEWAADHAAQRGETLLILLVLPQVPIPRRSHLFEAIASGDFPADLRRRGDARLAELTAGLAVTHPDLVVETAIVDGRPSEVLAQASRDAEMVVVGARGHHTPVSVRVLGGTADAVTAHAHGPIAVVTDLSEPVAGGPVVVGVDDSAESRAAIAYAADVARETGVGLLAIHAWDIGPMISGPEPWPLHIEDTMPTMETFAHDVLTEVLGEDPGVRIKIEAPPQRASRALVDASARASLLVVGSRGRGGFAGVMLGSTSREVLRDAHCPVVVIRR